MIYLSEIKKEDMEHIYSWFSDTEFLKYYDYYPPLPLPKAEVDKMFKYYEDSGKSKVFAVKKDSLTIGLAGFDDIIKENQAATLFIGLGSENERGKGYGRKAMDLLLEYGFKKEGIFREFVLRDGKRYNLLLYGLLKYEWEMNKEKILLA